MKPSPAAFLLPTLALLVPLLPLVVGRAPTLPRTAEPAPGPLVVVGGGGTPAEVVRRALELAGGPEARVAVLPQASSREDRGVSTVEMWEQAGARRVTLVDGMEAERAAAAVREADLIWMPGGSQSRLMEGLRELGLAEVVRRRHAAGAVVGGTSAGAAVMSARMLAGPPSEPGIRAGHADIGEGLGLWPSVCVDQHFVERDRYGRLLTATLEDPGTVGVGIGEKTAAIVHGTRFEAVGESAIVVIDARRAEVRAHPEPGSALGASDVRLHVLEPGASHDLGQKEGR